MPMKETKMSPGSTLLMLLLMLTLTACCGVGVNNPQVYEPLLPDSVIKSAPESFLVDYMRHSCALELVRGEKPSDDCKTAFPGGY